MACNCNECGGKIKGLAHIGIFVQDIEKSKAFYIDKLGFTLTHEDRMDNGTVLAFLDLGTCLIELVYSPDRAPREAGVVDHIAMEVEDIETLVCRLIEQQVTFLSDTISTGNIKGGVKNIFFIGPDNERLEFFEYTK